MDKYLQSKKTTNLLKAFLSLETVNEGQKFLRDLCTPEEIREMADRWEIAQLLSQGKTYRYIASKMNTSTTTVTRVANWLKNGMSGYKLVLQRLHRHSSPPPKGSGMH